jgi:secretion/DNA translocation related TadE-like protein
VSRHANDRGSATIWAAIGISVITAVLLVGLHLGSAVLARHRAEAAADLAALAAAAVAVEGVDAACRRAAQVASGGGGTVTSCLLDRWDAVVEVDVPIPIGVPGLDRATGRARAGPVPDTEVAPPCNPADTHCETTRGTVQEPRENAMGEAPCLPRRARFSTT